MTSGPPTRTGATPRASAARAPGPALFARFAYPPNALGLCGPDDSRAVLEYAAAGVADGGLRQLARGFDGAWPYLELIAGSSHIADPLDRRVVEAYWIGNDLASSVDMARLGAALDERFHRRAASSWPRIAAAVAAHGHPTHAFHVFAVYPWVGLLRGGAADHALHVIDRCRIRWGTLLEVSGDHAVVEVRRIVRTDSGLSLGAPERETATMAEDGYSLGPRPSPGTVVALHWDWICSPLTRRQVAELVGQTRFHLDLINRGWPALEV